MRLKNLTGRIYTSLFSRARDEQYYWGYKTGRAKAVINYGPHFREKFGKRPLGNGFFIEANGRGHEAINALQIFDENGKKDKPIGLACIGFGKNTLYIESIQGGFAESVTLKKLRRVLKGKAWQVLLIELAEEMARELGFKKIKIRAPELNYYYHKPFMMLEPANLSALKKHQLQEQGVSKDTAAEEVKEYTKKLYHDKKFLRSEKKRVLAKHQERMRELYKKSANAMGYATSGLFYVKKI
jgi:hypothetical protein